MAINYSSSMFGKLELLSLKVWTLNKALDLFGLVWTI